METSAIWFGAVCRKNGLNLTDRQTQLFEQYVNLLLDWNRKINLTSRKDEDRVWQNHILHSASILFKVKMAPHSRIMDLGSGGGLPGVPLKILLPDSEVLLVDSTRKKIQAVEDILSKLGLPGIEARWGRAEELVAQKNLVCHFDYIVARGVAPLRDLIKWSAPFLSPERKPLVKDHKGNDVLPSPALIALKGGDLEDELLKAKRGMPVGKIDVVNLVFPGSEEISATDKKIVIVHI